MPAQCAIERVSGQLDSHERPTVVARGSFGRLAAETRDAPARVPRRSAVASSLPLSPRPPCFRSPSSLVLPYPFSPRAPQPPSQRFLPICNSSSLAPRQQPPTSPRWQPRCRQPRLSSTSPPTMARMSPRSLARDLLFVPRPRLSPAAGQRPPTRRPTSSSWTQPCSGASSCSPRGRRRAHCPATRRRASQPLPKAWERRQQHTD
jgi:hypothetical protein